MTGTFIVLEGPDGCGTTLHTALLAEKLRAEGRTVITTFEPTDGQIGSTIRTALQSHQSFDSTELQQKFCADRAWHIEHVILPALRRGETVISDRYISSTLAYGEALDIPLDKLKKMNKNFIQPDRLFFLLPPIEVCRERLQKRSSLDALENLAFQGKVYANYQRMAEEDPAIIVIDTSGEKEEVAKTIYRELRIEN
ncbi:MAG: dTMP kinase [Candidatus Peregrinibacteria bacterium]